MQSRTGPAPLRLRFAGGEGTPLLASVHGEVDYANAFSMQVRIAAACRRREARGLILDVGGVDFMASCGFGAILNLQRELACRRGGMVLCGARGALRKALRLTGLDGRLIMAETPAEAETLLLYSAAGADAS
ncbi:MAG TPA: STAS domain-containing protein [Solirubrobacteraceae bacterium]|nr:STAS domain-containing protein [Solirubrobacteraceae bacterium]